MDNSYRANYSRHMASSAWQNRRDRYFVTHKKICSACKRQDLIELHHITYENFTKEPDEDLVALCQTCHMWVHQLQRTTNVSIREATNTVLNQPRKPRSQKQKPPPVGGKSGNQFRRLTHSEKIARELRAKK